MDYIDARIVKKIMHHIADHGEIKKFDALRMCENTAQLVRILAINKQLIERDGLITTQQEIDDAIQPSANCPLLRGHCTNGIGGSWMLT